MKVVQPFARTPAIAKRVCPFSAVEIRTAFREQSMYFEIKLSFEIR
jgi:hypothetical protein